MSDVNYTDEGIPYDPETGYNPLYPAAKQNNTQQYALPVEQPNFVQPSIEQKMQAIQIRTPAKKEPELKPVDMNNVQLKPVEHNPFETKKPDEDTITQKVINKLFGLNGEQRYQLWPERMVRDAIDAPHKALTTGFVPDSPEEIGAAQSISGMAGMGSVPNAAMSGIAKDTLGMVPIAAAKQMNVKTAETLPEILKSAVQNTPGASIDADGHLILNVARRQHPDQEGAESIRGGVFYLPQGSKNFSYTGKNGYGGSQIIEGGTAFKNPLVVKGATGGKAPENAYNQIIGAKDAYQNMRKEALQYDFGEKPYQKLERVHNFLNKYAPEMADYAQYIIDNSKNGNQLPYALQEAAVASAARKAGYDGIVGYSTKRSGEPFLSEIYDVRENRYPSRSGDYSVHDQFLYNDNRAGTAIGALAQSQKAPVFYSALENAVNGVSANKMQPQQWLGTLQNAKGVKPEEIDWTGLKDFLADKQGPVTKQEVQDFLNANKVELKEVNKGVVPVVTKPNPEEPHILEVYHPDDPNGEVNGMWGEIINKDGKFTVNVPEIPKNSFATQKEAEDFIAANSNLGSNTKYEKYQLPGGNNYREMLLTLPIDKISYAKKVAGEAWDRMTPEQQIEFANKPIKGGVDFGTYKSSHWDEPNVLAHVRMNDRVVDGKKSLHLEEVQSDWHQSGRDKGYKSGELTDEEKELQELNYKSWRDGLVGDDRTRQKELEQKVGQSLIAKTTGVPNAPFKKTWHELALKRMLREAAEKGYDRLSWTPGEAQAARYDLSKHLDQLIYRPPTNGQTKGTLTGFKGSNRVIEQAASPDELPAIVGKEAAEKLQKTKPEGDGSHKLRGVDLKVGGEGMKGFYDQIIPKALEKIGKEHGVKVKQGNLSVDRNKLLNNKDNIAPDMEAQNKYSSQWDKLKEQRRKLFEQSNDFKRELTEKQYQQVLKDMKSVDDKMDDLHGKMVNETIDRMIKTGKGEPIHYIDIPQSLKDQAMRKGFPLFSNGLVLSPVDHDPFSDDEIKNGNAT